MANIHKNVQVSMTDGSTVAIHALVVAGFAVHRTPYAAKSWSVTHIPSGVNVVFANTQKAAIAFAKKLDGIQWGGVALTELSGCEICANIIAISDLIKSRFSGKTFLSDEQILNNTERVALVLACKKVIAP